MPTLDTLTTSVYRDLADDAKAVFTTQQVQDFIRSGVVEVNRISPIETVVVPTLLANVLDYSVNLVTVSRVVIADQDTNEIGSLPLADFGGPDDGGDVLPQWGWRFRRSGDKGTLSLPRSLVDQYLAMDPNDIPQIRVWGYGYRTVPTVGPTETGLSYDEEYAVREWAKTEGYQLLTHDRSLFAQWQGQTNNTDVSPVMMMNMAAQAKQEWSRRRGLIRVIRKQG